MGEFSHQLLEVNGESGHSYTLRSRNEMPFGMNALNDTRAFAERRGHVAIIGAIQSSSKGVEGVIKVSPELSEEEIKTLGFESGIKAEPILH